MEKGGLSGGMDYYNSRLREWLSGRKAIIIRKIASDDKNILKKIAHDTSFLYIANITNIASN